MHGSIALSISGRLLGLYTKIIDFQFDFIFLPFCMRIGQMFNASQQIILLLNSDLHYEIQYSALQITVWCRRSTGRSVISQLDHILDMEPWQNIIYCSQLRWSWTNHWLKLLYDWPSGSLAQRMLTQLILANQIVLAHFVCVEQDHLEIDFPCTDLSRETIISLYYGCLLS